VGAFSAPPDPIVTLKGPTSKGMRGEGAGKGKRMEEGRKGEGPASKYFDLERPL